MSEGFELVGTITMRTDDKGYLDIVTHIDKTSNSSAPSNRDFYFEVAYKENPDNIVAISNTLTVRHLVPGNPEITLTTDKTEVVENNKSILTVQGVDFTKNASLSVKLYRKVDDSLASIIETKNVVTDDKGEFTLEIHQNYGNAAAIPSTRDFYAEATYVEGNTDIITSNTVEVKHIKKRTFKILTRSPDGQSYIDYNREYDTVSSYVVPGLVVIEDWWNEYPSYNSGHIPPNITNFKMVDTVTNVVPEETDLNVRWEFRYWLGIPLGLWSEYYYNWPGFDLTENETAKDDTGNLSNWEVVKDKYLSLDCFPVEIASTSVYHIHNAYWTAYLQVTLYVDDEVMDRETVSFYLPPQY